MYKLITPSNFFEDDLLERVCKNRKVDINKIKNPTVDDIIPFNYLDMLDRAVAIFGAYISSARAGSPVKIGMIVDSDCDGYTSSTILYRYLEKYFPEVELLYFIHSGKQHGVTEEAVSWAIEKDLSILFVPDAGSDDFESHKTLRENKIMTIVLDHHDSVGCSLNAVVVNSQHSLKYTNKQFSGVGITYKFLKALDDEFGLNGADDFLDLVAVGNVGDSMEMTEPETRYYVYEGIKQLKNEVLREMIFQFTGKFEKVNPNSLAFDVVPKINGMIRAGTQEEKIELFEALIGHNLDEKHENPKARNEANKIETFLKKAVRQAKNAHGRQNSSKKKWIDKLKKKVVEGQLDKGHIVMIVLTKKDKFDNNLTGVIAGSLTDYYAKPVLIMTKNEDGLCTGSMRGYDHFTMDTKSLLEATGKFEWVKGHANAAGVCIHEDNIPEVNTALTNVLKELVKIGAFQKTEKGTGKSIPVDFVLKADQVSGFIVDEVDKYIKYWGKGIEPPKFAVTDLTIDFSRIKISSGGKIDMEMNGVSYTQFTADTRFYDLQETHQDVTLNVVGTMGVNEFFGKVTKQFIISDFEIVKVEDNTKNKFKFIF